MRVVVVGAGSLGSVYGGLLARAGHDVQLLAREPHVRAIRAAGGLRLETGGEEVLVPVDAEWQPSRIRPAELAIVTTKTFDTAAALAALDHLRGDVAVAVSFQNSVEKDERLRDWCGAGPVVGGVSMVGATFVEPGFVRHTLDRATIVGELPTGTSPRVERLAGVFADAGLSGVVSTNVLGAEWAKLVHAVPAMALPALTRLHLHQVFLSPDLAGVYVRLVREGVAVAEAAGVELDEAPIEIPLREIAAAPDAQAVSLVHEQGRRFVDAGMTNIRVSMLQSVERGQRLEVEAVHGFVVREGARLGVPVPATELCYRLLAAIGGSLA